MIDRIASRSAKEGFPRSRLPEFTSEEIDFIKGTADYFGLNHYSSDMVAGAADLDEACGIADAPNFWLDQCTDSWKDPSWGESASDWLRVSEFWNRVLERLRVSVLQVVPEGFRLLLSWLKEEYNNPEIIVTENGFSDTGELDDQGRVNYYQVILIMLTCFVETLYALC